MVTLHPPQWHSQLSTNLDSTPKRTSISKENIWFKWPPMNECTYTAKFMSSWSHIPFTTRWMLVFLQTERVTTHPKDEQAKSTQGKVTIITTSLHFTENSSVLPFWQELRARNNLTYGLLAAQGWSMIYTRIHVRVACSYKALHDHIPPTSNVHYGRQGSTLRDTMGDP